MTPEEWLEAKLQEIRIRHLRSNSADWNLLECEPLQLFADFRGHRWCAQIVSCSGRDNVVSQTRNSVGQSDWPTPIEVTMQPTNWPVGWASTSKNYRAALQRAWESGADWSLIIEDDVIVGHHLWHNLTTWWPVVSEQVHFASLFCPHLIRDPFEREQSRLGYRIGSLARARGPHGTGWQYTRLWGSQGYLFSRQGLERFLAEWDFTSGGQDARAVTIALRNHWPLWYAMPDFVQHNPIVSAFSTPQAYSTDFDENYRAPDHVHAGEYLPGDGINGWLTYYEGRTLWELARGLRTLELGRHEGRSTVSLAQSAKELVSVDTSSPKHAQRWLEKFVPDRKPNTIHLLECDFAELPKRFPEPYFKFVFIDGDHTAAAVERDVTTVLPLLAPGALLAFHDYLEPRHPDVQPTVDRLANRHQWKRVRQIGRLVVLRS